MSDSVLYFDIETADADRLPDYGPDFVRLAAWAWDRGPVTVSSDIGELVRQIERARFVVGHNIIGFDLPALERYHGLNAGALVGDGRVIDTLLVARQNDPPRAGRADGGRYTLGALGLRLVGANKLGDADGSALMALAERFGGYDRIPVDHPRYRAYVAQDVELTREVAAQLRVDDYCRREMAVMWRAGQVERSGVRVDVAGAQARLAVQRARVFTARQALHDQFGLPEPAEGKSPEASDKGKAAIEACLRGMGIEPPRTPKGALCTRREVLVALTAQHPGNARLAELVGLLGVVTERLFAETVLDKVASDGRVYPRVSAEQATGRLSITRPGLTTSGKRKRHGVIERALFLPDNDDEVLLAADLSQIDARAMALVSGDAAYIEAFADGQDYHSVMAAALYGTDGWDGDGHHPRRSEAKAVVHGTTYGMGAGRLAGGAGITEEQARALLARLDQQFPALTAYKAAIRERARRGQVLRTPSGRTLRVEPGWEWTQAPAAIGQGTARDLLMQGVLALPQWLAERLRLIVHDEIVLSVPSERVDEARAALLQALELGGREFSLVEGAPGIRIRAEVAPPGRDWADCYRDDCGYWPEVARDHREQSRCEDPGCVWHTGDDRGGSDA